MDQAKLVRTANDSFYKAFESLDIDQMERIWLPASHIKCIHPGWPVLSGPGPVMQSWQRIFDSSESMKFDLAEVQVQVTGTTGWVVLLENLESQTGQGTSHSQILATNIFQERNGAWFIVHHHGSPILMPPTEATERLH